MGRMAVAAGGTCMGSAAALTSTGKWDKQAKQRIIIFLKIVDPSCQLTANVVFIIFNLQVKILKMSSSCTKSIQHIKMHEYLSDLQL